MSRSGYLKEHLAAWGLCAAIFAAMIVLSPMAGTDVKAAATTVATAPEGVREARGQRWHPVMSLSGQSNPWTERWADVVGEERTHWASGAAPSVPDRTAGRTVCQAAKPADAS